MGPLGRIARFLLNEAARRRVKRLKNVKIHPTARVNYRGLQLKESTVLDIGEGSVIIGSIIAEKDDVSILIGKNTFMAGSLIAAKRIEIGDDVLVAWECTIIDHNSHSILLGKRRHDLPAYRIGEKDWSIVTIRPVKILNGAWLGFRSIILKGVTVGEEAIVGPGSVVISNVADKVTVIGNPATNIFNTSL